MEKRKDGRVREWRGRKIQEKDDIAWDGWSREEMDEVKGWRKEWMVKVGLMEETTWKDEEENDGER